MPAQCIQVADVLAIRGLSPPELEVLSPTDQSYRALLLQPAGPIFADASRIGNWKETDACLRCKEFLALAAGGGHHLVVIPEYCLPIDVLTECVSGSTFPKADAVWMLGCESLTPARLAKFKQEVSGHCEVIHELDEAAAVQGTYFDAVACCFLAKDVVGAPRKVVLFQFKTCPSRDPHFLENEHLRRGQTIYQFRNKDGLFGLAAIICSDAFTLGDDAELCKKLTHLSTLIHIQLNPNPRHSDYRKYRTDTFARHRTFSDCDIICLNWAQNIKQYGTTADDAAPWCNIGGSAWYLPEHRCSTHDEQVVRNDSLGLYYTRLEKHRHALLFHYDEAAFELTVPKLATMGPAVLGNSLGPVANIRYIWDAVQGSWQSELEIPDTGLNALLTGDEHVVTAFATLKGAVDRLTIERAVALSCGPKGVSDSWYAVHNLETCQMKADEVVHRTTFCMDFHEDAKAGRHTRIQQVATLGYILANDVLPAQVRDLMDGGAKIIWSTASLNTNITKVGCQPALISYLGHQPLPERIKGVSDSLINLLRKEGRAHEKRVAVCYRKADGTAAFADMPALTRIDHDGGSLANITTVI